LADKIGRFCRPTKSGDFGWHTIDFCWAILSADKIDRFCRSSDIPLSLSGASYIECMEWSGHPKPRVDKRYQSVFASRGRPACEVDGWLSEYRRTCPSQRPDWVCTSHASVHPPTVYRNVRIFLSWSKNERIRLISMTLFPFLCKT